MWFQNVMNWLDTFFNKPLPIIGVSLIAILSFVWIIFKNTSFGKKSIKKATDTAKECIQKTEQIKEDAEIKISELKKEYEAKIKSLTTFYETCLAQKQAKEDRLEELVMIICDNVHNENIKKAILNYKKDIESCETIMTVKINETKKKVETEFDSRLKALEEKINEKAEIGNTTKESL